MKRSYFVFYGSAVAYCISMLAALQIGNPSTKPLTVPENTVSLWCLDLMNFVECKNIDYTEYSEKDMIVKAAIHVSEISSVKMSTSRERNEAPAGFKNGYHLKIGNLRSFSAVLVHNGSLNKILSFVPFDKLHASHEYLDTYADIETGKYQRSDRYPTENSKSMGGFDSIIEFPD